MSDPVTNVEIEDVLSSIRRLVSDEGRAARNAVDIQPREIKPEHEEDRETLDQVSEDGVPALILTPALRVADEADDASNPGADDAADGADHTPEDAVAAPLVLDWQDVPLEDEHSEFVELHENENQGETTEHSEEKPNYEGDSAPELDGDDHANMAAFDAAEAEEDDVSDVELMGEGAVLEDVLEDIKEPEVTAFHAPREATDLPPQAGLEDAGQARSIEDKIAALEALIGKSGSEFEPDGAEENSVPKAKSAGLPWTEEAAELALPDPETASQDADFNAEAIAFQAAHAAAAKEAEDGVIEAMTHTLPDGLGEDAAALIDEEALRDMVAEIVRQELQGPLGERITRNVRKLVRREIYRAMAANELD